MFRTKEPRKKRIIQDNKKNKLFKNKKLIFAFLVLIVSLIFYFLLFSPLFNVKKVDIILNNITCANSDSLKPSIISNKNIFLVNEKDLKDKIKNNFFCVKDVDVKKEFPDKLRVSLNNREKKAILNFFPPIIEKESSEAASLNIFESSESAKINYSYFFKGQPKKYLVDSEGIIFSEASNNANILEINLNYSDDIKLGEKISDEFIRGVNLVTKVIELNITIYKSAFMGPKILAITAINEDLEEFSLLFNLKNDELRQIASLQLILQKAKMNSNEGTIEMIDLRFDKPIVRYSPKKNG